MVRIAIPAICPRTRNRNTQLKRLLIFASCALFVAGDAFASAAHRSGHGEETGFDDHHPEMVVGEPAKISQVSRQVTIVMTETDDGDMVFQPKRIEVRTGESIRFTISNKGELDHEFVLDDRQGVMEHKALMEEFPEMEHDDPNSLRLEPGKIGEVIWKFTNSGPFEFACLIPGHYDSGMRGDISIVGKSAGN